MRSGDRGREVRRQLLAATAELIPEVGWSAVSTRSVAARAGLTAGLVHYHFPSVNALLTEATLSVMRELLDASTSALRQARTTEKGVTEMLRMLDAYTGRDPASLLFVEACLASTRDEVLRKELRGLMNDFRQTLAQWLGQHGQTQPEQTAAVLAAAVDGLMLHRAIDPKLRSKTVAPVLSRLVASNQS